MCDLSKKSTSSVFAGLAVRSLAPALLTACIGVVGVVPLSVSALDTIRVSTPRRECWDEEVTVRHRRHRDNGLGAVVGGVVGGAIGNAVGHGKSNKKVGAVVGAVLGATLGSAVAENARHSSGEGRRTRTEEVCKTYQDYREEERVIGYRVSYHFQDETHTMRLDEDPGDTVRLKLAISAAD
jgi:uncharacterized protein YcfJ